ncbi:universal stress protein [Natrononativus amylolyticus]|uniref:universal stress protein n=1 Tax=Natrononativus amylolyticus TaxID=2963434 RepID=UPI0020CE9AB5|nr:universal stress protein [Natrononativus amylolyticus]
MTVLVPYDGAPPAQRAVEHAVKNTSAEEIVLLRVIEVADGSLEAGVELVQEKLAERDDADTPELSAELETLLEAEPVEFRIETVIGKPAREIVSYAEETDVSHIVIGSHGREGASRVLLGSVAETVVRRAPTTVTVVR